MKAGSGFNPNRSTAEIVDIKTGAEISKARATLRNVLLRVRALAAIPANKDVRNHGLAVMAISEIQSDEEINRLEKCLLNQSIKQLPEDVKNFPWLSAIRSARIARRQSKEVRGPSH